MTVRTATHTPGPWFVHADGAIETALDKNHRIICSNFNYSHASTEADVRLIAAAPELYEALRDSLDALQLINRTVPFSRSINQTIAAARAALAKVSEVRP